MFQIAICDDEPRILEDISQKIKAVLSAAGIEADYFCTHSPITLMTHLKKEQTDILFVDIDMPGLTGMEIAEYLCNKGTETLLIFVTHYDALVYQSFQYHPFAFIRKSFFDQEIEKVLDSAIKTLTRRDDNLTLKTQQGWLRMKLSEILYFEADQNYIKAVTQTDVHRFRESLCELEKMLSVKGFIRIHKGYIVNQQYIYAMSSNELELQNGVMLPIGRSNRDKVKELVMKYFR